MSQLLKRADADRKITDAPAKAERVLGTAELDRVVAAGGNPTTSGNPVED
jgi:hypothetical protein